MKFLVLYDTNTGQILRMTGKRETAVVVGSGSGTLVTSGNYGLLTSDDLVGIATEDIENLVMVTPTRSKRRYLKTRHNDNQIEITPVRDLEAGAVTFEITKRGALQQFDDAAKAAAIADVKLEVGHDDVSAIKIDVGAHINLAEWVVNTSTQELEKKEATISYE